MRPGRRRWVLALLLALLAAGALVVAWRGGPADRPSERAARPAARSTGSPAPPAPAPDAGDPSSFPPVSVDIPAIAVRSRLERLGTDAGGALEPPRHPTRAGWYADGPAPGDLGPAVLAGHVDSARGPAVFWRLASLRRGDLVRVTRADGSAVRFRVSRVRHVDRDHFPTRAVYGPVPDRALRLITCGGTYDHAAGRYRQNVVVFALAV